jgi:catechol 2,3-dioxygenase-like lactoylglutathione lyase family enzyme
MTEVKREAMLSATRDLPSVRLSEIVLRTARYQEVKDWYQAVLGVDPYIDTNQFCFRRLHMDYPYSQVLAIFHVPEVESRPGPVAGLDHIQLRHASLEAMFVRFERLRTVGIIPDESMNHGPGTSFYYRDPDQNLVELSGPNFDNEQEYLAYFQSESYRNNIAGINVDPDDFVNRYRNGTPQSDLVKI